MLIGTLLHHTTHLVMSPEVRAGVSKHFGSKATSGFRNSTEGNTEDLGTDLFVKINFGARKRTVI